MTTEQPFKIAALGSSFASGPGIPPTVDRWARRSGRNYPQLVASALGADLIDVTSAGATTADLLNHRQRRRLRSRAPQVRAIPPDSTIVLITVGGNDVGYVREVNRVLRASVIAGRRSSWPSPSFVDRVSDDATWDRLCEQLILIAARVRERASSASVVFVDYLPLIGPGGSRQLAEHPAARSFADVGKRLSHTMEFAAGRSDSQFVPAPAHVGAAPWVSGRDTDPPFHPTAQGMVALAAAVVAHINSSSGTERERTR